MYDIQKDVPVPPQKPKYPFGDMAIGDSFVVPIDKRSSVISTSISWKKSKKHPERKKYIFVGRAISDTEARCWRLQ